MLNSRDVLRGVMNPRIASVLFCQCVNSFRMQDFRLKMSRVVSNKCSLAARVDACHEYPGGEKGQQLREEIEKKADKMQVRESLCKMSTRLLVSFLFLLCRNRHRLRAPELFPRPLMRQRSAGVGGACASRRSDTPSPSSGSR